VVRWKVAAGCLFTFVITSSGNLCGCKAFFFCTLTLWDERYGHWWKVPCNSDGLTVSAEREPPPVTRLWEQKHPAGTRLGAKLPSSWNHFKLSKVQHTRLLNGTLDFVQDYAGEPVPEPIWILLKQDSEWQWHQLSCIQICTLSQTDNHDSTPPLIFFTGQMPFVPPNQQCHSTDGIFQNCNWSVSFILLSCKLFKCGFW